MFEFLKPHRPSALLALDIGTEFIKALIFDIENNKAQIMGVGKIRHSPGNIHCGAIMDISSVIKNCKQAVKEAEREAHLKANKLIMGAGGDLIKGMSYVYAWQREKSTEKIDLTELQNILHKAQWKTFDNVRHKIAEETGYLEIDLKLVNAAIIDIRIDGYKVSNPIGFQGKEVKISIFNAFSPLVHFGALETIASELENLELISIISEPYAISRSLASEDEGNNSFIFIDIGGSTTDIAIVRNGSFEGTKMFSIGGNTFTRRIATELNISFEEAEKIKLAYSADELDKHSYTLIKKILTGDLSTWISGIELSLHDFKLNNLPSRILISGAGSHLPDILELLTDRAWIKNLPFNSPPTVKSFIPKDIFNIIDQTGRLTDPQDITPMALAGAALDLLMNEESFLSGTLKKLAGIIKV